MKIMNKDNSSLTISIKEENEETKEEENINNINNPNNK